MEDKLLDDSGIKTTNYGDLLHSDEKDIETRTSYKNQGDDELLVIDSDDDDQDDTLNLSNQNLKSIPMSIAKNRGSMINTLILTKNKLESLNGLEYFTNLETLQLDRNGLKSIDDFPKLANLKTLWLNNNNLKHLNSLLNILRSKCPNLNYLSLLFNPLCPTMDQSTSQLHKRYRLTVIFHLPNVNFLDTEQVLLSEKQESAKRGKFLVVAKPGKEQLEDLQDDVDEDINEDVSPYKNVKPAAFLGKGRIKYDGRESEGNRFILNQDL